MSPRRARGFTLLEVLVALAVLVVALSALVQAGGQRTENARYLRERTLATWVASDELARLRLAGGWPAVGTRSGEVTMAGREWSWRAEIEETPEERIRRVEMAVRANPDAEPLARMTGFLGHPDDRGAPATLEEGP